MGGIELLGAVCVLRGNISQESSSAAAHLPAPSAGWWGTSRAATKPSRALKGLGNLRGNLLRLLLQPSVRLLAKGLVCAMLKPSGRRCPSQPDGL